MFVCLPHWMAVVHMENHGSDSWFSTKNKLLFLAIISLNIRQGVLIFFI